MNAKVKRTLTSLLLVCVTALPCGLSFQHEALAGNTTPVENIDPSPPPALLSDHISYIAGYPDGSMGPSRTVTRAEAVTFLYRLLADPDSGTGSCSYTDVSDSDWFAEPVRAVCRLGLASDGYSFRPNDAITRAEFVSILVNLTDDVTASESFADVPTDYWAAEAISKAAALGWVGGYEDGTFRPENTLTRAEACAVFNRITNRAGDADQAKALLSLGLYSDVSANHWAGTDIVEASVGHTPGVAFLGEHWDSIDASGHHFDPGVHDINGNLYAVDHNGTLLTNQNVGAYTAAANGVLSQTASSMTSSVPYISQLDGINAEMGCEPISALMGLQGKGFATGVSASDFLDNLPYSASNPAYGFVGSPYYSDGRYSSIDPTPLANYCNTYCGGAAVCEDITGYSVQDIQRELLAGNFIVAYQTFSWASVRYANFYIDGVLTPKVANNHVRLIYGYDPARGYLVSDPYNASCRWQTYQYWIDSASFDYCWNQRKTGMVIR